MSLSRWCHPTISSSVPLPLLLLPSIFPSIKVFSNDSALRIMWPKYWSLTFNISPSSEHPGLISFRMDWLDLLAGQGTFKNLLQQHSSKASILWRSAFFIVQLSHLYMTIGKTIASTRQTFVSKVMSLLFSMLSRLVITFLPLVIQFSSVALCDSLWPHESQHEMQIQNYNSYHPTQVRMAIITKSTNNKCWRRCGAKGTLLHYWWECKLIQPLWRTA